MTQQELDFFRFSDELLQYVVFMKTKKFVFNDHFYETLPIIFKHFEFDEMFRALIYNNPGKKIFVHKIISVGESDVEVDNYDMDTYIMYYAIEV